MIEHSRAARPHYGLILAYIEGLHAGEKSRGAVEAALLAMRPDPTGPSAWADLPDCLGIVLDRVRSGALDLTAATALLLRMLSAG